MDTSNWLYSAYHWRDIGDSGKKNPDEALVKEKSMGT
jgi:hypothetical protein